jgi:hypothetical protein
MEGASKERIGVALTVKTKLVICNKLELGENRNKLKKQYGIGSWAMYDRYTTTETQAVAIFQCHYCDQAGAQNRVQLLVQVAYD